MLRSISTRCLRFRGLHTTNALRIDPKTVEEVRIPVPWGHIAGKWWGDRNQQPVLALHGLCDNCATFDSLLPLIDAPSVLAIDFPGHGFSSHIAPGLTYNFPHVVLSVRYLVKNHFGWPKVDLLTHSFGSCTAFAYSALFPKTVGKFISIDCARFNMSKGSPTPELLQLAVHLTLDKLEYEPLEKSYEQHLKELVENRDRNGYSLSEAAARTLLARMVKETDSGKHVETTDTRLPLYVGLMPLSTLDEMATRITCEVLSIRFSGGVFQKWRKEAYDRQLSILRATSSNLMAVDVDGGHHAHLESPESVAPHVNGFLKGS
uniref:Putative serine hydrolase n=1 Tax=Lygus hesperus TaxID=30085 RepID=A0A0A9W4F0_LYGHE